MSTKSFVCDKKTEEMIFHLIRELQKYSITKITVSDVIRYSIECAYKEHIQALSTVAQRRMSEHKELTRSLKL